MKTFREMLLEAQNENELSEVLSDIWSSYVEETGDEEGENFDTGLSLLMDYAEDIPADIAASIAQDLEEIFFDGDMEIKDADEDEDEDEMDESVNYTRLGEAIVISKSLRKKLNAKRKQLSGSNKRVTIKGGKLDVHILDRARSRMAKGSLGKKMRKASHKGMAIRKALKTKKKFGEL